MRGCLCHWTGLPGDVCTLVPGAEDQGGVVQDVFVQGGGCDCMIFSTVQCQEVSTNFLRKFFF